MRETYWMAPGLKTARYRLTSGYSYTVTSVHYAAGGRYLDTKSKRPKPKGFRYPTPYYAQYKKLIKGPYGVSSYHDSQTEGTIAGFHSGPDTLFTNYYGVTNLETENEAIMNALLNIREMKLDMGMMIAEMRETAGLIASAATTIGRSYLAFRRGHYKKTAELLGLTPRSFHPRNVAGAWLWYHWGVKPLLSDMDSAIQTLLANEPWRAWISAIGVAERTLPPQVHTLGGASSGSSVKLHLSAEHSTRVVLYAEPHTDLGRVAQQLGQANPFSAIYQGTFLTAAADWFLPMGDMLATIDAVRGLQFRAGCSSQRLTVHGEFRGATAASGQYSTQTSVVGSFEEVAVVRTVYDHFPTAHGVYFKNPIPRKRDPAVTRALTALSLCISFIKGNPPPRNLRL